jgi:hypothetical protein
MLLVSGAILVKAQNLQLHYDFGPDRGYLTSTIEKFAPDNYGSTFFFVDFNYSPDGPKEAYWEISRELKNWDLPISLHLEYDGGLNTGMQFNNAYLFGGAYNWNASDFSKGFSFQALYKHIQGNQSPHNIQLTTVWYLHMLEGKLSFTGFVDFWTEKHTVSNDGFVNDFQDVGFVILSEPQLWYKLNDSFSLGGEVELSYNFAGVAGMNACPTLGVKWIF